MSRIIHTGDTPGKRRHAHMRSCAEALRSLAQRPALADGHFDTEAKDLTAFLVLNLQGIRETIEDSAQSWEDRGYWDKAEKLRARWRWSRFAADELAACVVEDRWDEVTPLLMNLVPRFQKVTVATMTRDADWWCGAARALKRRAANEKRAAQTQAS